MKKIKAYKGFDKDLKCKGLQFEIGGKYHHEGKVIACESGFHSCLNPVDVLNYYDIAFSRFAEVLIWGELSYHKDDSKVASSDIEIVRELTLNEFVSSTIDSIINLTAEKNESVDYAKIGSSGYSAKIGSSGDYAKVGSSGDYAQIGSSGDYAQIGSSGYSAQIGSSGDYAQIGSSGNSAKVGSSGDYAQIGSSGDYAQIDILGNNSVCAGIGYNNTIKAVKGTWITLAEYDDNCKCVCVKSAKVDGKKIKADTLYQLKDKKFTEV